MNQYTVILLYRTSLGDCETHLLHISALGPPAEAAEVAQRRAAHANRSVTDPNDFRILYVFEGHLEDFS